MCPLILLLALLTAQASTPSTATQTNEQTGSSQSQQQSVDAAWGVLKGGLDDKSPDRRAKAARALGLLEHNDRAEQMAETTMVVDASADVRASAATALGQMDARNSIPKLKDALKDKDLKVVVAAANSLYIFKDPAAYDVYYALLTGQRKGPGLLESQMDTLKDKKQLEKLAFETGIGFIPFGGMGYEAYKTITKNDTAVLRVSAAEKLATDPDPKTTEALGRACSDKQWQVRVAVVDAIAKRGNAELLFSVTPLLYDNSDDVRYESAAAIIRLSTPAPAPKPSPKPPARKKRS